MSGRLRNHLNCHFELALCSKSLCILLRILHAVRAKLAAPIIPTGRGSMLYGLTIRQVFLD
ncbi:unnamed protein product [Photorhabdus laumondii subsp. laumondii TTO1]|uniref:Photorhabdus luminescens subsp. laumondii TTO1 complete genome segment 16/17 n=1 Tax=Photorhabdus laumondii subsp. laumondii (strain DSM 15139 / CIP 105565 / TT01) TaxID=243265 RepID=Q7MZ42_PHOLL|nr:unnamed protein product [Photorhabdus laumondii subsp. laumondii TTO1]